MAIENGAGVLGIKFPFFIKAILAVIGVLIALVFSGDITEDSKLKLNFTTFIKTIFGISVSLTGSPFVIQYMGWGNWGLSEHGFIFLMMAVFGLLVIGIIYRAIEIYRGKPLSDIINEVRKVLSAIVSGHNVDYSRPENDRRKDYESDQQDKE